MKIATLNDQFRRSFRGGTVLVTPGINALAPLLYQQIIAAVKLYDQFTEDNDPQGEHDFGAIDHAGLKVFWKIDYYDKEDQNYGSEDPADPAVTLRVLTIMLAEEY